MLYWKLSVKYGLIFQATCRIHRSIRNVTVIHKVLHQEDLIIEVIELIGLPGSGKTTLIDAIIKAYRMKDVDLYTVREALYYTWPKIGLAKILPSKVENKIISSLFRYSRIRADALKSFTEQHSSLIELTKWIQNNRGFSESENRMVTGWLNDLFALYELFSISFNENKKIIFDEGFSQRIITLFGYGVGVVDNEALNKYIREMPLPSAIFFIDADVEVCYERIKKRGYPERLKGKSESEIIEVLRNSRRCIICSLKVFNKMGIPVYAINNNSLILTARQDVCNVISRQSG